MKIAAMDQHFPQRHLLQLPKREATVPRRTSTVLVAMGQEGEEELVEEVAEMQEYMDAGDEQED